MRLGIIVAALFAAGMVASSAMAADLPVPSAPLLPPQVPAFTWDGPYVGASIGGGWGDETDDLSSTECPPDDTNCIPADAFSLNGFSAGIYGGENWSSDGYLFGIEGDLDYTNLTGSHAFSYGPFTDGNLALSTDWQAFIKVRGGVVVDRALLYGTVGFGAAHGTLTATPDPGDDEADTVSNSQWSTGWTAGLGAEYAFTDNLIGRAEIDYASFSGQTYDLGEWGNVNSSWNQTTAKVGLTVKF